MDKLTEIELDALCELFNIAMGSAAYSLSEMVSDEIKLDVPVARFLSNNQAKELLANDADAEVTAVTECFTGSLSGRATLYFPGSQSLELVRTIIGEDTPLEVLSEMEEESMIEISNIIINSCVSTIANFIGGELWTEVPQYSKRPSKDLFSVSSNNEGSATTPDGAVLLLKTNFELKIKKISGYVTFIMDISSIDEFKYSLDKHLKEAVGQI